MRSLSALIVAAFGLFLSGCQTFTSPMRIREFDQSKAQIVDYDADRRGQLIVPLGSKLSTCSEPQPDVAYNSTDKVAGSVTHPAGVAIDGSVEADETAQVINQNTQLVLFMREALFRLCEISLNEQLDKDQVEKLYSNVLETAQVVAKSAATAAEAAKTKADAQKTTADATKAQADTAKNKSLLELQTFQLKNDLPVIK